jgi:DNA-binding GntR family transcriptional regulator
MDAIAARDPDRAEMLARSHVRLLRDQARASLTEFDTPKQNGTSE